MSASTATAAVPEPNDTPGNTTPHTPAPGLLASMLAPVAPARTAAFSLTPQPADGTPATGAALPTEGLSSAALHSGGDTQTGTGNTGADSESGKQPKGVVRAWLLAGAARWARGGGTQNKRLDMKKARAMAHQVKEARTVNSGSVGTGSGGGRGTNASGTGGGKSLDSKSSKGGGGPAGAGAPKGPKNSTGPGSGAGRGPSGRDTSRSTDRSSSGEKPKAGVGNGGRGTSGSKGNTAPNQKPAAGDHNRAPKPSKGDTSSNSPKNSKDPKGGTAPGGKNGGPGAAGPAGKSGTGSNSKNDKPGKPTTPSDTKHSASKDASKDTKPTPTPGDTTGKPAGADATRDRSKLSLLKRKNKTGTTPTATDDKQPKATPDKTSETDKTDRPTAPGDPKTGKPFTTRPSRETGYRDGTRAAQATAHVKAYRDGVKDGFADTTEAADREKTRLDQAHADRKTARQETPVTTATSADHHQNTGPTPIPVDSVSKTHVFLGEGAHRASMTRGEVRSLKDHERRLEERATRLQNRAEQTRSLKAHAEEQATQATRLLEAARGAKGGDKLIGTLTKLQEAAQTQAAKAEEICKRSLRAAETTRTTLSNVQARYGGIYQAVVDAPEHAPGELDFYKG